MRKGWVVAVMISASALGTDSANFDIDEPAVSISGNYGTTFTSISLYPTAYSPPMAKV